MTTMPTQYRQHDTPSTIPNPSLFLRGLSLTLRNYPALLWTYVFNLVLPLLFLLRTHAQLRSILDTSLASQTLISGFDLSTVGDVFFKISQSAPGGTPFNFTGIFLYVLLYFVLVPGTLFCYQTAAPARLSTLLHSGLLHFWRFVRITLISLVAFALILGPLVALQNKWSDHVDETIVGRPAILLDLAGILLIGLVAAILRIYFDLVEVYTVQLGLQSSLTGAPDRRIRRTFLPAWRALRHNFARVYLTFILLTLAGLSAVIVTARIAMHSLAQPRVWPMFLLAQLGLFLMLFTRFWQRGAETILAERNPLLASTLKPSMATFPTDLPTIPIPPPSPVPDPGTPQPQPLPNPLPTPEPPSLSPPRPDHDVLRRNPGEDIVS